MNIGAKYYLAIFLKDGKICAKREVAVYFESDEAAKQEAKKYAKENNIIYDDIDVTYTHDESF